MTPVFQEHSPGSVCILKICDVSNNLEGALCRNGSLHLIASVEVHQNIGSISLKNPLIFQIPCSCQFCRIVFFCSSEQTPRRVWKRSRSEFGGATCSVSEKF